MPGGFSPLYAKMAEGGRLRLLLRGRLTDVGASCTACRIWACVGLRDMVDHARHVQSRVSIRSWSTPTPATATPRTSSSRPGVRASGRGRASRSKTRKPPRSRRRWPGGGYPVDEAVGKIKAAIAARNELDPDSSCAPAGLDWRRRRAFEDAVERAVAYVQDGGADFVWMNSVQTREQLKTACERIPLRR